MTPNKRYSGATSDINVTPLIDVMLVLLIIFMLVTPLTHAGLDVEIPTRRGDPPPPPTAQLVLEMGTRGVITLNKKPIELDELPMRIRDLFETRADKTLFFSAHETLKYGQIVTVLDILKGNGVERIGVIP